MIREARSLSVAWAFGFSLMAAIQKAKPRKRLTDASLARHADSGIGFYFAGRTSCGR